MFDPSLSHHINCLRFCFLGLIQSELDETRDLWNNHRIRKTSNSECPAGRPNILYFTPQISFGINYKLPLADQDYQIAKEFVEESALHRCTTEIAEFVSLIAKQNGIDRINDVDVAKNLLLLAIQAFV